MKKTTIFLLAVCTSFALNAQISTPQPSPTAKVTQVVGLSDVTLEYGKLIFIPILLIGEHLKAGMQVKLLQ